MRLHALIAACSLIGLCFVAFSSGSIHAEISVESATCVSRGYHGIRSIVLHGARISNPLSLRGASRETGLFPHYHVGSSLRLRGGGPKIPAKAAPAAGIKGKAPAKKVMHLIPHLGKPCGCHVRVKVLVPDI
jgi:hypothetical protein